MHVSPFLPMDLDYELRYTAPSERLMVGLDVIRGSERSGVTLSLRRMPLDRQALGRLLWSIPRSPTACRGYLLPSRRLGLKGRPSTLTRRAGVRA